MAFAVLVLVVVGAVRWHTAAGMFGFPATVRFGISFFCVCAYFCFCFCFWCVLFLLVLLFIYYLFICFLFWLFLALSDLARLKKMRYVFSFVMTTTWHGMIQAFILLLFLFHVLCTVLRFTLINSIYEQCKLYTCNISTRVGFIVKIVRTGHQQSCLCASTSGLFG